MVDNKGKKEKEKSCPKEGEIIQGKYEVIRQLGEGGFGAVYEVSDVKSYDLYAMKLELEKQPEDEPGLDFEAAVLKRLQGYNHVLRYVDEGEWGKEKFLYLVMQLAGPSLASLRKKSNQKKFSVSTATRIGMQSLSGIETMHIAGFLHRDVKPGNFAMGHAGSDLKVVFILDFGLVRKYLTPKGKIRPQRSSAGFRGSIQYASINAHRNIDLGRADDIWCWVYMMVQLCVGKLPWRNYNGKNKVGKVKMATTKSDLLKELEPEYGIIYDNLMTLKYVDEPPYTMYRECFTKIVTRRNINMEEQFDWEIETEEKSEKKKLAPTKVEEEGKTERSKIDKAADKSGEVESKNKGEPVKIASKKVEPPATSKIPQEKKDAPVAKQLNEKKSVAENTSPKSKQEKSVQTPKKDAPVLKQTNEKIEILSPAGAPQLNKKDVSISKTTESKIRKKLVAKIASKDKKTVVSVEKVTNESPPSKEIVPENVTKDKDNPVAKQMNISKPSKEFASNCDTTNAAVPEPEEKSSKSP